MKTNNIANAIGRTKMIHRNESLNNISVKIHTEVHMKTNKIANAIGQTKMIHRNESLNINPVEFS